MTGGVGSFLTVAGTIAAIYAILALSLNLQLGLSGLANFGLVGFFMIGSFTTGLLMLGPSSEFGGAASYILGLSLPAPVALAGAALVSAVFALAIGYVALRAGLNELYLAIATLAVAEIVRLVLETETGLANGYNGLLGIPQPMRQASDDLFGSGSYSTVFLIATLVILAVVLWYSIRLAKSPFGRVLRGVREDPVSVQALGFDVLRYRLRAFVIGGAIAGLAGGLWAIYLGSIQPQQFDTTEAFIVLAAVIIGGSGNMVGSVFGAAVVVGLLSQGSRYLPVDVDPQLFSAIRQIAIGAAFILVIRFRPAGLIPERPAKFDKLKGSGPAPGPQAPVRTAAPRA